MLVVRIKKVKGRPYYYGEIKVTRAHGRRETHTVYLGKMRPSPDRLKEKEQELLERIYGREAGKFSSEFLPMEQLVKIELAKGRFREYFKGLNRKDQWEIRKRATVDFVLTTLRTEGIPISAAAVEEAFELHSRQERPALRDEELEIATGMLKGLDLLEHAPAKLTESGLLTLHSVIMQTFESKAPGRLREGPVYIHQFDPATMQEKEIAYRPPPAGQVRQGLAEFIDWYNGCRLHPLEKAALAHYKLYRLHPFLDGNKRMCRLLLNKALLDEGYPMLNISKNRNEYFKALIKATEAGQPKPLIEYVAKAFLEQNRYFKKKARRQKKPRR